MSTPSRTSIRFTSRSLADGREIIYVDEPGTPERTAEDPRPIEPRVESGELRHDALVDDWVAVAAHRQHRTFMPPKDECPLCPAGHVGVGVDLAVRVRQGHADLAATATQSSTRASWRSSPERTRGSTGRGSSAVRSGVPGSST